MRQKRAEIWAKRTDLQPGSGKSDSFLGVALLNQGENNQAIEAFRRAYPMRSDDTELNFNLWVGLIPRSSLRELVKVAGR